MNVSNSEVVVVTEYSSLRTCKKALQQLEDLLLEFMEMDEELKRFKKALGNGDITWKPRPSALVKL